MGSMIDEALALARRGFRIVPIHTPGPNGCSCEKGAACGGSTGKHPRLNAWQRDATSDAEIIRRWWRSWPDANIGLVMGGASRLVAVDIDGPEGRGTLARLELAHGTLPETLTSRSGRVDGGEHRFFRVPAGLDLKAIKNRAGRAGGPMPKVDIRAEAGQVVAPPSLHASGNRYSWANRGASIAELPRWLYDLATWEPPPVQVERPVHEPSVVERARAYTSKIHGAVSGQGGHSHTLLVAEHLVRGFELPDGAAMMLLSEWNRTCDPPWSERELRHKIHEARTRGTAVRWGAHTQNEQPFRPRIVPPQVAPRQVPGDGAVLGLLGTIVDVPAIVDDPAVAARLDGLNGDFLLTIAAVRRANGHEDMIGRTPEPFRAFVTRRVTEPVYHDAEDAVQWFMHYARVVAKTRRATQTRNRAMVDDE